MAAKVPKRSTVISPQDSLSHSRDFLLGLSRAAESIQQAHTTEEIYRAVGDQIKSLGCDVTLLMVNDDRQSLTAAYLSYAPSLLRKIEKLMGFSAQGYRIVFPPESIYARNIAAGKTEYVHWANEHIDQALPAALRPLTAQLVSLLKIEQGILAPLHVDGEALGLMMVSGLELNEDDVPAMQSFAGQIAAGLRNVRLMQKLQDELSARRQVEESLSHNRSLLLALSRAAQAIQRVRTSEEIYRVMGEQINALGFEATILTVDSRHKNLYLSYTTLSDGIINIAEKMAGLVAQGYTWSISPDSIYGKIVEKGMAEYIPSAGELFAEALPKPLRPLTGKLMRLLKVEHGIIAPLHVDEETLGLLIVFGSNRLSVEELPAIDSFAGQVAVSLRNARLVQQMQEELSARKQAEEAIRQAERHFKALIEKAPDGIALLGMNGTIIYASPSAKKIFGYNSEDRLHSNPLEFIHPDDLDIVIGAMNGLIQDPAYVPTVQYRYKNKDDSWHWVESTFSNLLAESSVQAVVINFRDITERKQAEEALKQSEARYRLLADHTTDTIWTADLNLKTTYISPSAEKIRGLTVEQLHDLPLDQNLTPHSFQLAMEAFATEIPKVYADPNYSPIITLELEFLNRDGTIYSTESKLSIIRDENGTPISILGESRDIAERKRAEVALRASEESFKSLYQIIRLMTDNLPDLVWAKDMDGYFIFANKAMVEKLLIAQNTDEPIGRTDMYFAERQRTAHSENPDWHTFGELCVNSDKVVHASQQSERFEEFGNVKGEFLFLDVYKAPFLDEQGRMIGTVGIGRDVTRERKLKEERQQAQDALAASEAELRALFASMQDEVLVIDREGTYLKVATTNPDKYYITLQELLGKKLADIFPAKQAESFLSVIQQVLETQQTRHIEYELNVNGQSPWFEAFVSPMDTERTLWVARDISERKQAEAKLYLQSAALEAAANTIVITDHKGIIEWANSSFTNLTGFNAREVIGRNPGELVKSGKQDQQFYTDMWATILSGKIWHNELINRRKNGTYYAEEMTITPLRNFEGDISHFIAVKQDISERKKAEALLIQSEQAYRALFENMPIGLYRTSADGQFLDLNPALVRMFGYPDRSSLLAMNVKDLYADPATDNNFRNEISKSGVLSAFESKFQRYDQITFWAEDYVHAICDEAGTPLYYEGSLIDITDRKHAEDELRRANKSLENTHAELQQMFEHEQILARTDGLTNLFNRRHFYELAMREFSASIRYQRALSILLVDVDGFKQANDAFGHAFGDSLLIQIAQITASQLRDVDVLARYGGDEFIILLPQTNTQQAMLIAERIRECAASARIQAENTFIIVTLSIGVAETTHAPRDRMVEDVIRRADKALYMAKQKGRNNTVVYTETQPD